MQNNMNFRRHARGLPMQVCRRQNRSACPGCFEASSPSNSQAYLCQTCSFEPLACFEAWEGYPSRRTVKAFTQNLLAQVCKRRIWCSLRTCACLVDASNSWGHCGLRSQLRTARNAVSALLGTPFGGAVAGSAAEIVERCCVAVYMSDTAISEGPTSFNHLFVLTSI